VVRGLFDFEESRKLDEITNAYAVLIRWGYHDQAAIVLNIIKILQAKEKEIMEDAQKKFPIPPKEA
jgi:hypothetical protein